MKKVHRTVRSTAIAVLAGLLITACGEAPEPTVSDVTIDPAEATVMRSRSRYFVATVTGTNDPAQTVMWSIVESDVHEETGIDENGKLTISANEPLGTLTVQAVSTVDTTKSKTVTVTIIDNDSNVEVKPDRLPEKWREYTFDEWMNWWETSFANVSEQETEEIYAFFRIDTNFDQLSKEGEDFWYSFVFLTDD